MKRRPALKAVRAALPRDGEREAFLDAAYEMSGRAWVRLEEKNGRLSVALTPMSRVGGLAAGFREAYARARVRRADAKRERALEAAALSRALQLAESVDARRREPQPSLPPERLAEIAAVLAEHEAARKDYGGITTPWEELRKKWGS